MNAAGEETRGGRRGNDAMKSSGQARQTQGLREGTPGAPQNRRAGNKGGNKQNESLTSSPASSRNDSAPQPSAGSKAAMNGITSVSSQVPVAGKAADSKAILYKPDPKAQATVKSESPWGAKPGAMANGKDFWIEMRKQVAALQQSGGTSQGG